MQYLRLLAFTVLACLAASAQSNSYSVTPIITNTDTGVGTDPLLVNPWGLSRPLNPSLAENQWWAADNATGYSTLYTVNNTGDANIVPLKIVIPPAVSPGTGSPTGTAFNPSNNNFTFVTQDGTLSNWDAGEKPAAPGSGCFRCHVDTATIKVDNSALGASYEGLTLARNAASGALAYYVANSNGGIEAYYAATFAPVPLVAGAFTDANIPGTYAPSGIQAIGSKIFVAYNAVGGGGAGYVDAFNTNGKLLLRLQSVGLNQPWGIAIAPTGFGSFSRALLVGNTGSGRIGAYHPRTGKFLGFLKDAGGNPIVIPGLWGIEFGNGNAESGPTNVLYFNGGGDYTSGVFGAISAN